MTLAALTLPTALLVSSLVATCALAALAVGYWLGCGDCRTRRREILRDSDPKTD
jgi:hypothetical protein